MTGALPPLNCNGCTTCCRGDTITIQPYEDASRWRTVLHPDTGLRTLTKRQDGNCVYLGPAGCRIHGQAPAMCQMFDCRIYFQKVFAMSARERAHRYADPLKAAALKEGRDRLARIEGLAA